MVQITGTEVHVLKTGPLHSTIERYCEPYKGRPFLEVLGLLDLKRTVRSGPSPLCCLNFTSCSFLWNTVCASACVCVCKCMCTCTYVEGRGQCCLSSSITLHHIFFETRSLHWTYGSLFWLDWLASESPFPARRLQACWACWASELRFTCLQSTPLTHEAISQPPGQLWIPKCRAPWLEETIISFPPLSSLLISLSLPSSSSFIPCVYPTTAQAAGKLVSVPSYT